MNDFRPEEETTPRGEYKAINGIFGQQGWICLQCGRVYSPFTQMCLYCGKQDITTTAPNTITNVRRELVDYV